jgi:hypothetical protein
MTAFTAYFDGSGSPDDPNTPVLTVAGFVATTEQWIEFERNWKDACTDFGVSALHMRDFSHSKREFESWKGDIEKRDRFMRRLVSIIRTRVRNSFASVVVLKDYAEMSNSYQGFEMKPYTLAASTCMDKVRRWADRQHVDKSLIAYVFEDGDADQGDFAHEAKRDFQVDPIFLAKKETPAFQAADLLAYEYFKGNRKIYESGLGSLYVTDLRRCLQELEKIPNGIDSDDWGVHDRESMTKALTFKK